MEGEEVLKMAKVEALQATEVLQDELRDMRDEWTQHEQEIITGWQESTSMLWEQCSRIAEEAEMSRDVMHREWEECAALEAERDVECATFTVEREKERIMLEAEREEGCAAFEVQMARECATFEAQITMEHAAFREEREREHAAFEVEREAWRAKLASQNARLKQQNAMMRKQAYRIPGQKHWAAERSAECTLKNAWKKGGLQCKLQFKTKGIIPEKTCSLVRDLVDNGVPTSQVNKTIKAVAEASGVPVEGSLSKCSVGRIKLEGYVASKIQIVDDISQAEGITLSGDGTTHKHINYESCHIYINNGNSHNHTSEVQLEGWKAITSDIYETYNASLHGQQNPQDVRSFPTKVTGANTDHAEDQKKLITLIRDHQEELLPILQEESMHTIQAAGRSDAWSQMSESDQDRLHQVTLKQIIEQLSDKQYAALPEDEKQRKGAFVWGGCCMHKDLNAVKGGNASMVAFWTKAGLTGPILLMNRENADAATSGDSVARSRAEDVSEGGGIKTTKLGGAIFRHRDDKKGQQDSLQIFFEASSAVGAMVHFPDTSNTRYQSHCAAAEELLVHLPLYIQFLEAVHDKKDNHTFNHMEANLFKALHDIPTLTELAVLALYSQAICHPYLREVQGPDQEHTNFLDLGPLHNRVKSHCHNIAMNPLILLAPDASYSMGALDGNPWQRPEVIYTIHRLQPQLLHLSEVLTEFCKGALATWERFTNEFAEGGVINSLSVAEQKKD
ncbi:hypothetical protein WOLCODRAFT_19599 [Wolfiporia cocos MD-104 SS10]|uniref:Uncharacterized protein n=1 Tax=Wolfiporia cocos (strain MD-104) TaxID=742152 RepID=A0A2H3JDP0_WOLCO|nr:hypothetical protein WOLCODRAFT_19599 [Wolfiporia cocos MD-104 SS10]